MLRWLIGFLSDIAGIGPPPQLLVARHPKWAKLAKEWLKDHPYCAVCGTPDDVTPHHIIPVHVDRGFELDADNLITLCDRDHLLVGHCCMWRAYNPHVKADAKHLAERIRLRRFR